MEKLMMSVILVNYYFHDKKPNWTSCTGNMVKYMSDYLSLRMILYYKSKIWDCQIHTNEVLMIATKPMYSFVVIKFSSFISTEQSAFQKSIKVMYERAKVAK